MVVVVEGGLVVVVLGAVRGAVVTGGATYTGAGVVVGGDVTCVTLATVVVVEGEVVVDVRVIDEGAARFVATTIPTPTPRANTAVPIQAKTLEMRRISALLNS